MLKKSLAEFVSPGPEFRGAPFWAWNGKLEEQELRAQIRTMKSMGLGGFFMHSRVGLGTKYLSNEWFKLIGACIDEAEKQQMNAWLYDEDRWPSGAAGGIVTKEKKYRLHYLECIRGTEIPEAKEAEVIARFAAVMEGNVLLSYRRLKGKAQPSGEEVLLTFRLRTPETSAWFNGQTYLDTLNPEAVEKFITSTHDAYKKQFKDKFGKAVPGIFSDEPNFMSGTSEESLPWTPGLEKTFAKKYHYDVLDVLPELRFIYRDEGFSKYRMNYRNLLTDLFCHAFSKQIGNWCGRNGLGMTGHVLCEDWLDRQTRCVGSAMRFYEYMQVPGIDLLTEHWNIFNTAKQCVSMAHQFGQKRRLSETYGCTGWDFPFIGHKALGDWQYALGINLRCQHLAWYTMEAQAKRDYPASISYQSPWSDRYGKVEDYFARLGAMLSEGEEIRDLLVIHPIETCWGKYVAGITLPDNCRFVALTNELLGLHLDFDFGEEDVIARHGAVLKKSFKVGQASYKAVLLPVMTTIRKTTLDLLKKFADNGGKVFYMGIPERLDGERSAVPAQVFEAFQSVTYSGLDRALSPEVRHVSVLDKSGFEITPVLYHLNGGPGYETLFVCNTSCQFKDEQMSMPLVRDRKLAFPGAKIHWNVPDDFNLYRLDPETGKIRRQPARREKGVAVIDFSFEILGSGLFLASKKPLKAEAPQQKQERKAALRPCPAGRFKVMLEDPNVLVLDTPLCTADGKPVESRNFLQLDILLRQMLGKPGRSGQMVQPWLQTKTPPERQLKIELEYTIRCKDLPEKECLLAVERPDLYTFTFNGKPLPAEEKGWWCDHSIRCLRLPADRFRKGVNKLVLSGLYSEKLPGLESLFLLGDFGVAEDDVLVKPETSLKAGDWTKQGLPYYSGNLIYHLPLPENTGTVAFPEWRGVGLETSADGKNGWTTLAWYPFEVSVEGTKTLYVRVLGSRRNAFGPFHLKDDWPAWCGPAQFNEWEKDEKGLVPCGLLEKPLIG